LQLASVRLAWQLYNKDMYCHRWHQCYLWAAGREAWRFGVGFVQ